MATVLGIMSGTSIDSVDYAVCRITDRQIRLRNYWQVKFPRALRHRLHAAAQGQALSHEVGQLHHELGQFYATHCRSTKVDFAGLHGQTIFHNPHRKRPATFQLGESAWLAERLRVPVVSNFRAGDMAAGGQGAPLATVFHLQVFAERGRHVCFNNLGGISNVTSMDWTSGQTPRVLSFDTGPANILMNLAMRSLTGGASEMDRDGRYAGQGQVHEEVVRQCLAHPFIRRKPPKSTGRELFGEMYLERLLQQSRLSPCDLIATLTEFTARSILENYRRHLRSKPDRIILGGGGACNPVLRERIAQLSRVEVTTTEPLGWPLQAIEPAAFALLAYKRMKGEPGNLPETTGAKHPVLLGQVTISSPKPGRALRARSPGKKVL